MSTTWFYALASVVVVSAISLVGLAFVAIKPQQLRRALFALISLAASSMFGDVFIQLLPESYAQAGSFIYMAGADLLPELHKELTPAKSLIQLIVMGLALD